MTTYPGQIDNSISLPVVVDNSTPVRADAVNRLRSAIIAIEAELGAKPSSTYSTVRSRLDIIENIVGNLQIISLDKDLGGTLAEPLVIGIQGRPISTEAPSLGAILSWNGIAWAPVSTDIESNLILPSGDLTGVTDWTNIQAYIGNGLEALLLNNGIYYIKQPLLPKSGFKLISSGISTITKGSLWANSNGVDPLNSFIHSIEIESVVAATTVATTAPAGSPSIIVTNATGFSADGYFKITGWSESGVNDFWEQSASQNETPTEELFQIDDSYISGTTILLTENSILHHGANDGYKPVKLLTSIVENGLIEGIRFDGYGYAIAGAIYNRFAKNIIIRKCEFKGFTGRAVNSRGSKYIVKEDCVDLGANNCLVEFYSCQRSKASRWYPKHEIKERFNTRGSAKPLYHFMRRAQCRDIIFDDCISLDAVGGFLMWGGVNCHEYKCHAITPNIEPLITESIGDGYMYLGLGATENGIRGWAFDGGANTVGSNGFAEFGYGNSHDITDHDGSCGSALHYISLDIPNRWHMAFYFHDDNNAISINFSTTSKGLSPINATHKRYLGFKAQDCSAHSGSINMIGTYGGVVVDGVYNILENIDVHHNPRSGVVDSGGVFHLFLEGGLGLRLRSLTGNSVVEPIMMGTIVDGGFLYRAPIIEFAQFEWSGVWNSGIMRNIIIARRPDGYAAHVPAVAYELDPAGTAAKRDCFGAVATAGTYAGIVAVSSAYAGYTGTQRYFAGIELKDGCTTPILALGAIPGKTPLELDANGKAIVLSSVTPGEVARCIGRNTTLTSGAGIIQIGT